MTGKIPVDTTSSPAIVARNGDERRILILAPMGDDAQLTAGFLIKADLSPLICEDVQELCDEIGHGCGAIILAEEILYESSIQNLVSLLAGQPPWSDIPVVIVARRGEASRMQLHQLTIFGPAANVTLLERPFRPGTLISTLGVALRARQRQYEARDFVETLKRAHDEVQRASQAKDNFLAALSHELRTPLSPVLLIASEYASDNRLPDEVRQGFQTILKNIELEARLIDDLLDLTRVTSGKLILKRENLDLHKILMDALGTVRAEIQNKQIQLNFNWTAERCIVNGDPVRLQQVFWNILKNAVKFTSEHGTITVESSVVPKQKQNPDLLVRITDTGIGMTPEESARVFQAFVQGDHANVDSTYHFGGLGLGLAISKRIVHFHSGTITAESAGRNRGATFTVTLPLVGAS